MLYSFTITVPPFHRIDEKTTFKYATTLVQRTNIEDAILERSRKLQMFFCDFELIDYTFERHEDRRLHCHGIFKTNDEDVADDFALAIFEKYQTKRWDWMEGDGRKVILYEKLETQADVENWKRYIHKCDGDIPQFNLFLKDDREANRADTESPQ